MPRRIEIELTSARDDGQWTWRAAGARQPKGTVDGGILPAGAKVGDVLKVEAEIELDGITVLSLSPVQQRERSEPERIEIVGSGRRDDSPVITTLAPKRERDRRDGDRKPRRDRPPRDGESRDGNRDRDRERRDDRTPRRERPPAADRRPRRPAPPPMPERPKPKRLRPGRVHRKEVLAGLAPEQQLVAEQVLKGGIAAVRQAIDEENAKRIAAGDSKIDGKELVAMAERLLPQLRTAEWRDRADAAIADADQLDLRDLRSVVVASDAAARDDETRAVAAQLRETLEKRVEAEHATWLEDLELALTSGRVVRALRMSSRPPKAGTILAAELRARLTEATAASLTVDAAADRWGAVLDAAAHSPVHNDVAPAGVPEAPSDELQATVRRFASRVPKVAAAFGIEPPPPGTRPPRGPRRPPRPPKAKAEPKPTPQEPKSELADETGPITPETSATSEQSPEPADERSDLADETGAITPETSAGSEEAEPSVLAGAEDAAAAAPAAELPGA